jgi:hypothetical protein
MRFDPVRPRQIDGPSTDRRRDTAPADQPTRLVEGQDPQWAVRGLEEAPVPHGSASDRR